MRTVKGPISDINCIEWKGHIVYILFDSDKQRNASVKVAERILASELKSRGTSVRQIDLPDRPNFDKTDADDFLVHPDGGPVRLLALIDNSKPDGPVPAGEILYRAGIADLTAQNRIDMVEAALQRLRMETTGADYLRETAVHSEATKHF